MASTAKAPVAGAADSTATNPRGIPYAPFVDKVEDYVATRSDVEPTLRSFQEMISKYQFMELNLQRRMTGLKDKIPDIQKTLDTDETDPIETTFELNDTLYAKANIPPTEEVYIWLGANVMLSYPIDEAETLLSTKLSTAKTSLSNCEEDLDFLREQITTMEVATARVYNWEVVQKRKEKTEEEEENKQRSKGNTDSPNGDNYKTLQLHNTNDTISPQEFLRAPCNDVHGGPFRGSPARLGHPKPAWKTTISRSNWEGNTQRPQDTYLMMRKILDPEEETPEVRLGWRERVARMRMKRLPLFLLQRILQEQALADDDERLMRLLPLAKHMQEQEMEFYKEGYSKEDLDYFCRVLTCENDDDRCKTFLSYPRQQPIFIVNFLLRRRSSFRDPELLAGLIDHCRLWYNGKNEWEKDPVTSKQNQTQRTLKSMRDMDVANFSRLMSLLSYHCQRLEPRFIVRVAELVAERIESLLSNGQRPEKIFHDQCLLLNECLGAFQYTLKRQAPKVALPNAYFWEAQRTLLQMSSNLQRPLLVNAKGFRAIRQALAGLPKNSAERHSSTRHSPTWPPYLQPGDGMDEGLEAEDVWTRSVQAGVMMQEAGYAKEEVDESLDMLQGLAPDGTPTIQQRITSRLGRTIRPWEAAIRATRNAQEAWMRFRNPPQQVVGDQLVEPGPDEYAAMFEKLLLPESDPESSVLPGDKALNFATAPEANLSDLERVRLQPPSVSELYQEMQAKGVTMNVRCLRVLLESAPSFATAHDYLRDSAGGEESANVLCLTEFDPKRRRLQAVDMGIFLSYITASSRIQVPGKTRVFLARAINLIDKRMRAMDARWTAIVWRPILKVLDLPAHMLGLKNREQLELIVYALQKIETHELIPLSIFVHICRCVRNMIRRVVLRMADHLDGSENMDTALTPNILAEQALGSLYFKSKSHASSLRNAEVLAKLEDDHWKAQDLFQEGTRMTKRLFQMLVEQEKSVQKMLQGQEVPPLERMLIRKDPVRADHAHEYMLVLAFVGETQEMLAVARWLVKEWGQEDVAEALSRLEDVPPAMALSQPLCAYRLLAEPRLDPEATTTLREGLEDRGLGWMWPSDEAVQAYAVGTRSQAAAKLARVMSYVEASQKERSREDAEHTEPNYGGDEIDFLAEDPRATMEADTTAELEPTERTVCGTTARRGG
ncbi:putative prefoldin subunit 3 [Paramyrothecium foliicola]|nr:putative prefoldin subunit 3 [Paramyrothecium foliicola]